VVVADATKIGHTAFARICETAEVDTLVTDARIAPEQVARLEAAGVQVIVV